VTARGASVTAGGGKCDCKRAKVDVLSQSR
jgi:hypothetical protein